MRRPSYLVRWDGKEYVATEIEEIYRSGRDCIIKQVGVDEGAAPKPVKALKLLRKARR